MRSVHVLSLALGLALVGCTSSEFEFPDPTEDSGADVADVSTPEDTLDQADVHDATDTGEEPDDVDDATSDTEVGSDTDEPDTEEPDTEEPEVEDDADTEEPDIEDGADTEEPTNTPPSITPIADQINNQGDSVFLQIHASDEDGDHLSFSATSLPNGLSIHPETGEITGTLPREGAGDALWNVEIHVDDGEDTTTATFTWTVIWTNRPPVVDPIANQTNTAGDTVSLVITGSDPDWTPLTWSFTGLPPGLYWAPTSPNSVKVEGTLDFDLGSTWFVTVWASDGELRTHQTFIWTVIPLPLCERELVPVPGALGLPESGQITSVHWADFNDDGLQDVFLRGSGIWRQVPGEGFVLLEAQSDAEPSPFGAAVGDLDLDGYPDLFIPAASGSSVTGPGNRLYVAARDGLGRWTGVQEQSQPWKLRWPNTSPASAAFLDIDGNGNPDISIVSASGFAGAAWNLDGTAPIVEDPSALKPESLRGVHHAWADFNGDGCPDVLVGSPGMLRLYVCQGGGTSWLSLGSHAASIAAAPGSIIWAGLTWADINGDGLLDIHAVVLDGPDLVWIQDPLTATFSYAEASKFGLGDSEMPISAAVWADYNNDGFLDVLLPDIGLFQGNGAGVFQDVTEQVGYEPGKVYAAGFADFNNDGHLDLLTAGATGVRLYQNEARDGLCIHALSAKIAVATLFNDSSPSQYIIAPGARLDLDVDGDGVFESDPDAGQFMTTWLVGQAQSGRASANQQEIHIGLGHRPRGNIRVTFPNGQVRTLVVEASASTFWVTDD